MRQSAHGLGAHIRTELSPPDVLRDIEPLKLSARSTTGMASGAAGPIVATTPTRRGEIFIVSSNT
jgi:hypothetical protein